MPTLTRAEGAILERIYDETWSLWGDGLTREAYARFNDAQMRTEWGAANLERVAWVDGGELLASAKRYWLTLSLSGEPVRCLGIGAVFTPPAMRGRGHAAAMIEAMIEAASRDGVEYALLYSEIGGDYYARLGFDALPLSETLVTLKPQPRPGAPAVLVRAGDDRDFADIATMHERRASGFLLAQQRSAGYARHAIAKQRMLAALSAPGVRHVEFFIAEEGASAVAYVAITHGLGGRVLQEWGDRDPTGARVGAMLQVLAARTPAEALEPMRTWLPDEFLPPQLEWLGTAAPREVPMLRRLAPGRPAAADLAGDLFLLKGDAF